MVTRDAPQFTICQDALLLPLNQLNQKFLHHAGCAKSGLANCVLLTPPAERNRASVMLKHHSSILLAAAAAEKTRQTGIYHDFQSKLQTHCSAHESNLLNLQSELSELLRT